MNYELLRTDFLVIGSGVAGLRAAIALADAGDVVVLAKSALSEGSTEYAQGGVAVALSDDDEIVFHEQDTLRAGDMLCDKEAVRILVTEGPKRIEELIQWGASFDTENGKLWFSLEGAHSRRRVIHSHGDSTGAEIERALLAKTKPYKNITFLDHAFTIDLLVHEGTCCGAFILVGQQRFRLVCVEAKATVLATGGAGQVYSVTTNPDVATGDGPAIAFRAGAELADMEFVQFHPTALYKKGVPTFLLSEAMRGEGGVLRNATGERFMLRAHPQAELAPRDVVSRAIVTEIHESGSDEIYLDLRHLKSGFVRERFPRIYETCLKFGLHADRDLLPIRPAAHYIMGGVRSDKDGKASLPGLFACGEVACTGVHGANRLASNSLLEGIVFGKRAGDSAKDLLARSTRAPESLIRDRVHELALGSDISLSKIGEAKKQMQEMMWEDVGIIRDFAGLESARAVLSRLAFLVEIMFPDPAALEARNMFYTAAAIRFAAAERTESRGAHYRSDFPSTDDQHWLIHRTISAEMGLDSLLA